MSGRSRVGSRRILFDVTIIVNDIAKSAFVDTRDDIEEILKYGFIETILNHSNSSIPVIFEGLELRDFYNSVFKFEYETGLTRYLLEEYLPIVLRYYEIMLSDTDVSLVNIHAFTLYGSAVYIDYTIVRG